MIPKRKDEWTDFSVDEWHRLNGISFQYESRLRTAFLRSVRIGQFRKDDSFVKETITDCVVEVAVTTAQVYGLMFNPESPRYRKLIDDLTDSYMRVVNNDAAKREVQKILPRGLSLQERKSRTNVMGLDTKSAVRLENMRQQGIPQHQINAARFEMSLQRGNLVAATEVNRIINATIETLLTDNIGISKAAKVVPIASLPKRARKEIITRRDNRVCDYCEPLDGTKAKIGDYFVTPYGYFAFPPFHPRCRCYMVVSL